MVHRVRLLRVMVVAWELALSLATASSLSMSTDFHDLLPHGYEHNTIASAISSKVVARILHSQRCVSADRLNADMTEVSRSLTRRRHSVSSSKALPIIRSIRCFSSWFSKNPCHTA